MSVSVLEREIVNKGLQLKGLKIGIKLLKAQRAQLWCEVSLIRATVEKRYRSYAVQQQLEESQRLRKANRLDSLLLKHSKAITKTQVIRLKRKLRWAQVIQIAQAETPEHTFSETPDQTCLGTPGPTYAEALE